MDLAVDLTHEQKLCVNFGGDNLLVRGIPGSGKTLVLIRRAKKLAISASSTPGMGAPVEAVHLFTFAGALDRLTKEVIELKGWHDIGVSTFHSWAMQLLRDLGLPNWTVRDRDQVALLEELLAGVQSDDSVLKRDIRQFWITEMKWIKGRGIGSETEYVEATRSGLGTRLDRKKRPIVWSVFEQYRGRLASQNKVDWEDFAPLLLANLKRIPASRKIRHILIDEAQDLTLSELRLLRGMATESLSIAADEKQQIYNHGFTWKEVGIDIRGQASKRLKGTHRSTKQIISLARTLQLENQEEEPLPDADGPVPVVHHFSNEEAEKVWVANYVKVLHGREPGIRTAIIASEWKLLFHFRHKLKGLNVEVLKDRDSMIMTPGVKLTSCHSAKGLEFDHVIVHRVNEGLIPRDQAQTGQEEMNVAEYLMQWRRLLYVAMTRARLSLTITCSSPPSRFLYELDETLHTVRKH